MDTTAGWATAISTDHGSVSGDRGSCVLEIGVRFIYFNLFNGVPVLVPVRASPVPGRCCATRELF